MNDRLALTDLSALTLHPFTIVQHCGVVAQTNKATNKKKTKENTDLESCFPNINLQFYLGAAKEIFNVDMIEMLVLLLR